MAVFKRSFYEAADVDPAIATAMFHIALKRLGGSLSISREEIETYDGIETETLVEGTLSEEDDNVEWVAAAVLEFQPKGA